MRLLTVLLLLLGSQACGRSPEEFDKEYQQARHAIWLGDFPEAESIAAHALSRTSAAANPAWYWRFRLLSGEVALLNRDFATTDTVVKAAIPQGSDLDGLHALQKLLEAKLQIEQGHVRDGHETLAAARRVVSADLDMSLEIDRLDGQSLLRLGQLKEGEALLHQVLSAAIAASDRYHEATSANDLGRGLMLRNRYDEALPYFERVMAMQDLHGYSIYAVSSHNAGICYQRLGQFEKAMLVEQRAIAAQEQRGKREYFVQALGEMGNLYYLRGDSERAVPFLQRALEAALAANLSVDAARLAGNLSSVEADLHRWDEAERYNEEAQRLWLKEHGEPSAYHLLNRAVIAKGRGQLDQAADVLSKIIATPNLPPSVLWDAHFDLANVELTRGQPARATRQFDAALHVIETTRAGLIRTDDKIQYLTRLISFYQSYVSALVAEGQIAKALEIADSSRGQLLAERAATAAPSRSGAPAFQRIARDSGAVLLSYWLTPSESYLWVVAPSGLHLIALPDAGAIDALVRQHQAVIADAMSHPLTALNMPGDKLYEMLIKPAAQWIPKDARVIVVPDGPLHEINFETLTVPGPTHHYWIDDVQVEMAPSLGTLTAPGVPLEKSAGRLLLVGNAAGHAPDFPRLAHAADEMSNISSHFGADEVTRLDGDRASPDGYASARPEQFAYVHFTAHAATNRESPLDSIVVLSGPEDRYKLYARTVAALPLRARLVTIPACRSAGDKAYTGEGLVGFSWAFLKAGARNVVAGLWDVDDSTTPELMDRFYAGIASGHAPGRALRDAKRAMIADGGAAAAPYRWAALELFTASLQ